jgi:hypothetical protein
LFDLEEVEELYATHNGYRLSADDQKFDGINLFVCDDAAPNEIADFVANDTHNKRFILIHAKAARETRIRSASALSEVCSQAIKNLEFVSPFLDGEPPNRLRWDGPWKIEGEQVSHRIRSSLILSSEVWNQM